MIDLCENCHCELDPERDGCEAGLCEDCSEEWEDSHDCEPTSKADVRCPDCAGRRLVLHTYKDMSPDIVLHCRDCQNDFEIGDLPPFED